jgi:hypothetical protein
VRELPPAGVGLHRWTLSRRGLNRAVPSAQPHESGQRGLCAAFDMGESHTRLLEEQRSSLCWVKRRSNSG